MRRTPAFLGALAVLTPLLLTNASAASATSAGTLTVTTLGRDGKAVASTVQAVNTKTHTVYHLTGGKAHTLPKGSYDVITDVWNTKDDTDTVGAKVVTVSGAAKATIDARQGRPVKASISPGLGSGYEQKLMLDVCVPNSEGELVAWNGPGNLFVIPSSASAFELAYSSSWTSTTNSTVSSYLNVGEHTKGLPNGISTAVHQSSLATVKVSARSGPETGDATTELSSDTGDSCVWGLKDQTAEAALPFSFTAHVTPGSWNVSEWAQDFLYDQPHTYRAGKSYTLNVNRAVWGPSGELPSTSGSDRRLYLNSTALFADGTLPDSVGATTAYKLTKAGKTLLSKTLARNSQASLDPVLKSAGWYTLTESATRSPLPGQKLPSTALSTKSALSLHFYANPATSDQIRGYVTRFNPAGLNSSNQALPGSSTTVTLGMQRTKPSDDQGVHQLSDAVKKVQAWDSTDGGKTWHAVTVKHSGSTWTTVVRNPASGRVSLRSEVTDSHSDTSTTTVVNAYAVG